MNYLIKNYFILNFNLLHKSDIDDFTKLLTDFNYDDDEINDLIYAKDGLINRKMYWISVIVDYDKYEIIAITRE